MEDLINYASLLYDDTADQTAPLPPAPNDEPARYEYGSAFTHFTSLPPRDSGHAGEQTGDFAPALPPRPDESIHPSKRAGRIVRSEPDTLDAPRSPGKPDSTETEYTPLPTQEADATALSPLDASHHEPIIP